MICYLRAAGDDDLCREVRVILAYTLEFRLRDPIPVCGFDQPEDKRHD